MRRGNTRLPLELALAKAALPEASGDPAALAARLDRLERRSGMSGSSEVSADRGGEFAPRGGATAVLQDVAPLAESTPAGFEAVSVKVALDRVDVRETPPEPQRVTSSEPQAEPRAAGAVVDFGLLKQSWPAVLDRIKQQTIRMHALVAMSHPTAFDGSTLQLEFKTGHRFHADQCGGEEGQKVIGGAIHDVLGVRPRLLCTVADHEEAAGDAGHEAEAAAVAEREAMEAAGDLPDEDQLHQQAIDTLRRNLGATIVDQPE
jgi:DNA polymerase-3 subunit gamma/tau